MSKKVKPMSHDGINFTIEGCTVRHIPRTEILKEGMLIRNLIEDYGKWSVSERYHYNSWHKLEKELSGWIGKTYQEYMDFGHHKMVEPIHEVIEVIK